MISGSNDCSSGEYSILVRNTGSGAFEKTTDTNFVRNTTDTYTSNSKVNYVCN